MMNKIDRWSWKLNGYFKGSDEHRFNRIMMKWIFSCIILCQTLTFAQESQQRSASPETLLVTQKVEVSPEISDGAIAQRLRDILLATDWFTDIEVEVTEGVVFLEGKTDREEYRDWAAELARNTRDVVAVVNRISILERSDWDMAPAMSELAGLWRKILKIFPLLLIGVVVLLVTWFVMKFTAAGARRIFRRRITTPLLLDIVAKALSIPVFLLGLYFVLQISGLTRLAVTVLGATGLFGLVIGFAFRDIMENFLASMLISVRRPFLINDTIQIENHVGVVQKVTTRGTVIMAYDGNHIQIPNAIVYKSVIINYTANPNRRMDFDVGIGYENDIPAAQDAAMQVLANHTAVMKNPEPLVLVEKLGSATVNLRIYFWFDGLKHNGLKIKSSLIRRVKRAFEEKGYSMPDKAREIIFPQGVPVQMLEKQTAQSEGDGTGAESRISKTNPMATASEGDLSSDDAQIQQQARTARSPEEGDDLL